MTQEDKELLVKDLCARLPYGVVGQCEIDASYDTSFDTIPQTHKFNATAYGLKEDSLFVIPMIEDEDEQDFANEEVADGIDILDFKPYLFPLSSMTEEEAKELSVLYGIKDILSINITDEYIDFKVDDGFCSFERKTIWYNEIISSTETFDWLNKNHFDYRGLISMGLAIDATDKNIYMDLPDTYE